MMVLFSKMTHASTNYQPKNHFEYYLYLYLFIKKITVLFATVKNDE
jgi:hypothetical protein